MTIRSPHDTERCILAITPVDEAFRASEAKWGVARLERLVGTASLAAYRRGWTLWREAVLEGNADQLEAVGPKMVIALQVMDAEATAAGHKPLSGDRWEAATDDGRVLVVVRTQAEAHAIAREPKDGRDVVVWTMDELARMVRALESVDAVKLAFPGAEVVRLSGVQRSEGFVSDWATSDPLLETLHG